MNEIQKEILVLLQEKSDELGHPLRKRDNKITKDVRFRILTNDNPKFMKEIGWLK